MTDPTCQYVEGNRAGVLVVSLAAMVCAACAAPLQRATTARPPTRAERASSPAANNLGRPRIGVAFGGGSARGIAHVGVIRWLEEHRIPIDVAAGTSMGGLVGGAFATGMDARELEMFIGSIDWDQLFGASSFGTRTSGAKPTRERIRLGSNSD